MHPWRYFVVWAVAKVCKLYIQGRTIDCFCFPWQPSSNERCFYISSSWMHASPVTEVCGVVSDSVLHLRSQSHPRARTTASIILGISWTSLPTIGTEVSYALYFIFLGIIITPSSLTSLNNLYLCIITSRKYVLQETCKNVENRTYTIKRNCY